MGLDCGLDPPEIGRLSRPDGARIAETYVSCYPNAALPITLGDPDASQEHRAGCIAEFAEDSPGRPGQMITTEQHSTTSPGSPRSSRGRPRREIQEIQLATRLSGLEPLDVADGSLFVNIGGRNNGARSSARFRNLIEAKDYDAAL